MLFYKFFFLITFLLIGEYVTSFSFFIFFKKKIKNENISLDVYLDYYCSNILILKKIFTFFIFNDEEYFKNFFLKYFLLSNMMWVASYYLNLKIWTLMFIFLSFAILFLNKIAKKYFIF